ncbi:uncharacterized protein LOC124153999 [Ischnura elegans]|uniref:uncharacterized protein LOC124153999 n=1 Tax=Ischnura elegans TaxID=197161 RepID=UPI001ED89916|nr:uncharacterized protein LOC124153999 [Ischnura elegans]
MKVAMGSGEAKGPMDVLRRFMRRVSDDFKHKDLMPIKVIFFVQSSTLFVLYPFLTIHMKELGIGVEEAAAMNALSPFIAVLMPPLAGLVADRIGNFRVLLALLSAVGGGVSLLLLLVPPARHHPPLPSTLSMVMMEEADVGGGGFLVQPLPGHLPCTFLDFKNGSHPLVLALRQCGHSCPSQGNATESTNSTTAAVNGTFSGRISDSLVFRPDDQGSVGLDCGPNCTWGRPPGGIRPPDDQTLLFTANVLWNTGSNATGALMLDSMMSSEARNGSSDGWGEDVDGRKEGGGGGPVAVAWMMSMDDGSADRQESASSGKCRPACIVTTPREGVCVEKLAAVAVPNNPKLTFWSYLAIRVLIGAVGGTAFAMFEGAVIALLRKHGADYGLQRIYAAIGAMIASPLSGLLLDAGGATDFRPAFYLYAVLKVVSGLLVLTIDLEFKSPAKKVVKEVITALRNLELVAILAAALALGAAWGFLEGFLFWLLQDLGASKMLMGLTVTVGGAAGLPLLALAGPITDRIGHHAVIAVSFLVYAIRLLGYSLLVNPWLCLVFEAMEGVTSSLAVTACVTAVASRSTTSTDSSLQGLLGGIYYGVGRGLGSLVGGLLMGSLGSRETFRLFAGMCAAVGVVYLWTSRHAFGQLTPKARKAAKEKKLKEAEEGARAKEAEAAENTIERNGDLNATKEGPLREDKGAVITAEDGREIKTDKGEEETGKESAQEDVDPKNAEEDEGKVAEKKQRTEGSRSSEPDQDTRTTEDGLEGHVNLALEVDEEVVDATKAVKVDGDKEREGAEKTADKRD